MKSLFVFLFLFIATICGAQNDPSFRQFYFNPFHFNPAYTGIDGYTDIYFSVRKQWVDFKDAPLVSQFSAQYATGKRLSLGFTVSDQEVVALQNTFISTAFAYRVPMTKNKSITFGLSGGVGVSNLDLGNYDYSNDPTVLNAATTSVYGNAGFGMLYVWDRLRIGFALPQLFGQNYISPQKLGNRNFAQLQKQNYSASYKFFTGPFTFEPWFLFRLSNDNQNSWDGGATVAFNQRIWLGASYNAQQGPGFFLGLEIKEIVKIGYSYELPPSNDGFIQTKSMEFQLRIRLNPRRNYPMRPVDSQLPAGAKSVVVESHQEVPVVQNQEQTKPSEINPFVVKKKDSSAVKLLVKTDSVSNPKTSNDNPKVEKPKEDVTPTGLTDQPSRLKRGYYLVMGSFKNPDFANNYKADLIRKGFSETDISFNEGTGLYLVHAFYSESKDDAQKRISEFQLKGLKPFLLFVQ